MLNLDRLKEKTRKGLRPLRELDVFLAAPLEQAFLLFSRPSSHPLLFILGLPRTGTTLVYQYVVHRLQVAYFTNGVGRFYLAPCLATWVQRTLNSEYESDFMSEYGSVLGPMAPQEAGRFWGRFFDFEDYVSPEHVSPQSRRKLRRTIACVQRLFGNPLLVNKNVKHILRIPVLDAIFPNAFFLRVERDHVDVALSLLRARYANLEDPSDWWSARPPNHQDLQDLPKDEQIARQVKALDRKVETDLSKIPSDRVLRINYQAFCNGPDALIRTIRSRIQPTELRNPKKKRFRPSTNTAQTQEEKRLVERIKALDLS